MATYYSDKAYDPAVTNAHGGVVVGVYAKAALTTALVANDIIKMVKIPAYAKIVDAWMAADDIDTNGTPTSALSLGILNAGQTDLAGITGNLLVSAQAGRTGAVNRADVLAGTNTGLLGAASSSELMLGIKCITASATWAAGSVYVYVAYLQLG